MSILSLMQALKTSMQQEVIDKLILGKVDPKSKGCVMLKVKRNKKVEENVVVGDTTFSFNEEGFAEVPDVANAKVDYELLLSKPGYFKVEDEVKPVVEAPVEVEEVKEPLPEVEVEVKVEKKVVEPVVEAPVVEDLKKLKKGKDKQ